MEAGRRIFGRFEVVGPLPDIGELERHAAIEVETGRPVELVRPSALAALRPGARERFRAAWNPDEASHLPPARLPALALGEVDGRPSAVRPRIARAWSPTLRIPVDAARELAGWFLPALTVAPPPEGWLSGADLVVDSSGRPWLAPSGVVPKPTVHSPPLYSPPSEDDSPVDRARYGLGVSLFRAVTGEWPFEPTGDRARLAERQRTPRPVREAAAGLPSDLANLIDALVHPDPHVRGAAALPPPLRPPVLSLPEGPNRPPALRSAPPPPSARTGARLDTPMAPFVIVLHNDRATDGARTRLAALLDRPADAFVLPAGAPNEVLVDSAATPELAATRLAELQASGAPLSVVGTDMPAPVRNALVGGGLALVLLAPLLAFLAGIAGLAAAAVPALLALAWGWKGAAEASNRRDALRRTGQFAERGPRPAAALADGVQQVTLGRRAQAARKAVLQADLPDSVRIDLFASIDELAATGSSGQSTAAVEAGLDEIAETARSWSNSDLSTDAALERARRAVAAARSVQR